NQDVVDFDDSVDEEDEEDVEGGQEEDFADALAHANATDDGYEDYFADADDGAVEQTAAAGAKDSSSPTTQRLHREEGSLLTKTQKQLAALKQDLWIHKHDMQVRQMQRGDLNLPSAPAAAAPGGRTLSPKQKAANKKKANEEKVTQRVGLTVSQLKALPSKEAHMNSPALSESARTKRGLNAAITTLAKSPSKKNDELTAFLVSKGNADAARAEARAEAERARAEAAEKRDMLILEDRRFAREERQEERRLEREQKAREWQAEMEERREERKRLDRIADEEREERRIERRKQEKVEAEEREIRMIRLRLLMNGSGAGAGEGGGVGGGVGGFGL
ncbi:hypothetical protein HDU80_003116, partial [Chytriomyces hyalinus]